VVLSERERRVLAEIERDLCDSDPRLARSMRNGLTGAAKWTRAGCDAVVVVAGLSALLCLSLSLIEPAVVAALLAWAAFVLRTRLPPRTAG
jgi:Protein of unknown function (DUF3040)